MRAEALAARLLAFGQLHLSITGNSGRVLDLQGTPDLFHWALLGRYTNPDGLLVLTSARRLDTVPTSIAPRPSR